MIPADLVAALSAVVGADRVHLDAPLARYTTFRVGGPADCLVEVQNSEQLLAVGRAAAKASVSATILGGGSNTIVSDRGVRGVVIRVHGGEIAEEEERTTEPRPTPSGPGAERREIRPSGPVQERADPSVFVRADAGVTMNALVRWTIGRGFAGLEAWAGTPGTVGGAICGNAHYGGRHIADLVFSVRFLEGDGHTVSELHREHLGFSYDHSRFLDTREVVLAAVFVLERGGDPARLRDVARGSLAHRKRTQPLSVPSAGCIFQNPDPGRDPVQHGIPWSAGALVDRAGLKGRRIGGALISPTHANFIVTDGQATATQIRALVRLCESEVRRQFGVELREEVRWVGEFGDETQTIDD